MRFPAIRKLLALAAGLALFGVQPAAAARPAHSSVACLDSSSPSYALDKHVVAALGVYGERLTPFVFDGGYGVSERFFKYLSRTKCAIIMGYPVDGANPDAPDGLAFTKSYARTAYILVARHPITQATLRVNTSIAVGMATSPHFYLAGAFGPVPNYTADTFQSQEQALDALAAHHDDAAMVWKPSWLRYARLHPAARAWSTAPLRIPHAQWQIAALYAADDAGNAARFNRALARYMASPAYLALARPLTETSSQ